MLAARIRPAAVPLHELLYAMADTSAQKMQQLREAKEDALMTVCSVACSTDMTDISAYRTTLSPQQDQVLHLAEWTPTCTS